MCMCIIIIIIIIIKIISLRTFGPDRRMNRVSWRTVASKQIKWADAWEKSVPPYGSPVESAGEVEGLIKRPKRQTREIHKPGGFAGSTQWSHDPLD